MDMGGAPVPPAAAENVDHRGHAEDATDPALPPRLDLCHAMTLWLVIGHDKMVEPPLPNSLYPTATTAVHDKGFQDLLAELPDPRVRVRFLATSLVPHVMGPGADAVLERMHQQLAPDLFASPKSQFWQQLRDEHGGRVVPPGKHFQDVVHDSHVYELYAFLARHFLDRDSALVLSDLDESDERWNLLSTARARVVARLEIQVLSLNTTSAHALEVAVEATTPTFDSLRDIADLAAVLACADPNAPPLLRVLEVELLPLAEGDPYARARVHRGCARPVTDLRLSDVARDWVRGLQLEWKLKPRQAARVWEMVVLAALRDARVPVPHELQMLVKQRLFREGKADWVDVPRREQVDVLHRQYVAVMDRV
ncbi:hypothetical protein GGF31_006732 [Allomyces arbusculus]|nr:hypothetical protein GGF31_006732 [Allomyces arbusculus]